MCFLFQPERKTERERERAVQLGTKEKGPLSAADNNCTEALAQLAKTKDAEIIQQAVTPAGRTRDSRTAGRAVQLAGRLPFLDSRRAAPRRALLCSRLFCVLISFAFHNKVPQ